MTDTLVEKVRKLLALADSPNEHEAALAAQKAQELMLRHGLDMAQVAISEGRTSIAVDASEIRYEKSRIAPWRRSLAGVIARAMGGRVVYEHGDGPATLHLFGPSGTVEPMVALYHYLDTQLTTISAVATANREETWIHGRTWRQSYLRGAIDSLWGRLREHHDDIAYEGGRDNSKALVLVQNAVDQAVNDRFDRLQADRRSFDSRDVDFDDFGGWSGYDAGFEAGLGIDLNDPKLGSRRALTAA
jgi:hypothetical protein